MHSYNKVTINCLSKIKFNMLNLERSIKKQYKKDVYISTLEVRYNYT